MGLASIFALGVQAQTTLKVKSPIKKSVSTDFKRVSTANKTAKNGNDHNSVQLITANMAVNSLYTAGTTFDLNLVLTLDQNDAEYGDQLTITFPNSVTINSTTNTPDLGPDDGAGSSDGPEAYVGVTGQTITWGNDDNTYGGIVPGQAYPITINISVAPGTTGDIVCNYHVDGDQYVNPQDFDGTFNINEQQNSNATVLASTLLQVSGNACGLTSDNFALIFKNNGTSPLLAGLPGDTLVYTVNGVTIKVPTSDGGQTSIMTDLTGAPVTTVAAGDTAAIIVAAPIDLSTPGTTYTISSYISFAGYGDLVATDDTASDIIVTHLSPVNVDATNYFENFENGGIAGANFVGEDVDGAGLNIFDSPVGYASSTSALWFFENNVNAASDDWAFTPCLNLTAGNTYYVKSFARLTTGYNGTLSYSLNSDQTSGTSVLAIGDHSPLAANSTYTADSISFVATTTGTFYLGLHAQNTDATKSLSMRVDNITVGLVPSTVGIKTNVSTDAISIYPNPSNGVFTVKVSENEASMEVYSIIGENVYSSKVVKGNNTVDLSNLAAGSYIVKINNGGKSTAKRIVINK